MRVRPDGSMGVEIAHLSISCLRGQRVSQRHCSVSAATAVKVNSLRLYSWRHSDASWSASMRRCCLSARLVSRNCGVAINELVLPQKHESSVPRPARAALPLVLHGSHDHRCGQRFLIVLLRPQARQPAPQNRRLETCEQERRHRRSIQCCLHTSLRSC